jgi:hypothetical protein
MAAAASILLRRKVLKALRQSIWTGKVGDEVHRNRFPPSLIDLQRMQFPLKFLTCIFHGHVHDADMFMH